MKKTFSPKLRAVIFDGDGTLLKIENPYFSIAQQLGCIEESKHLVRLYLTGDISYRQLASDESGLFVERFKKKFSRSPMKGDFEQFLPPIAVREGVKELVAAIKEKNIDIFVLSTGVSDMIIQLSQLGIPEDHLFSNRFLYDSSGKYRGRDIVVSGEKKEFR